MEPAFDAQGEKLLNPVIFMQGGREAGVKRITL
jgi:hypothetical protein